LYLEKSIHRVANRAPRRAADRAKRASSLPKDATRGGRIDRGVNDCDIFLP
jgi:hypothetical protein